MTVDDFINQNNGQHVDEDGYYGAQCWDLVAKYARVVVGCPSFPTGSGGAEGLYRLFQNPIPQYFDRIANDPNDPNQLPQKGDVIVWMASFSPPYGHTALVVSADASGPTVLEQNGNNPGGVAYIKKRNWVGVSGWLRPKKGSDDVITDADNEYNRYNDMFIRIRGRAASRAEFVKYAVGKTWLGAIEMLSDSSEANDAQHAQEVGQVAVRDKWDEQIYTLQDQLKAAQDDAASKEGALQSQVTDLQTQLTALNTKVDELVKSNDLKDKRIADLQKQVPGSDTVEQPVVSKSIWDVIKDFLSQFKKG